MVLNESLSPGCHCTLQSVTSQVVSNVSSEAFSINAVNDGTKCCGVVAFRAATVALTTTLTQNDDSCCFPPAPPLLV